MKTAEEYLRPYVGTEPGPYLAYVDALKAVQAAIDNYDPLPGTLTLAYRVLEPPKPLRNVFPPACGRCGQRGAECLCEQPPF